MSTENRNKVLLGFGALVVVLVVAIALWPPNFRKEDASGAIGAVQKHHAPQITQKDVILGGEKTKHQQKVLYADFLADASKLQGVSTELRAADASARITAVRGELAALDGELNVRYAEEFSLALAEAEAASRNMHRATLDDELNQMQSFLAAHRTNL